MLLDDEDYAYLRDKTIYYTKGAYPSFNHKGSREYVHRFVTNVPQHKIIDHENMDILDNRKSNLRITNHTNNKGNIKKYDLDNPTSKYKGVTFDKANRNWVARVVYKGEVYYRGRYSREESAARAYNYYARKAFGEFAFPNRIAKEKDNDDWRSDKLTKDLSKNQSGYKYVSWSTESNMWMGHVTKEGKQTKVISSEDKAVCLLAVNGFILENNLHNTEKRPRELQLLSDDDRSFLDEEQLMIYEAQLKEINKYK